MARKTKQEAELTREAILDAAEQVFHEKGVSRSGLEEIALRAGCTRGAVYWHFEHKRDVLQALKLRIDALIATHQQAMLERSLTDPMGAMRDFLIYVGEELLLDARAARILDILFHRCEYVDEMRGLLEFHGDRADAFDQTLKLCRHARDIGQIRKELSPELCATMLHTTLEGMIRYRLIQSLPCESAVPNRVIVDFLLSSFGYECADMAARPAMQHKASAAQAKVN